MLRQKTFEELVDDIGLATVFTGTTVDELTQQLILDWFFDYKLIGKDDTQFLRYFRRRLNNLYPRYLDQLRINSIIAGMDPFVTDYYQEVIAHEGESTDTSNKTGTSEGTSSQDVTKGSGTTTVRTPDLVTSSQDTGTTSNTGSVINSGSDTSTHTGTETDSNTGTDTTDRQNSDRTTHNATETANGSSTATSSTTSKGDTIGVAYPEANMSSANIVADPTAGRQLDYVDSETLTASKADTSDTGTTHNTTTNSSTDTTNGSGRDVTTHDTNGEKTTDTQDVTEYGSRANTTESGTSTNSGTVTNTGTETTVVNGTGTDTTRSTSDGTTTEEVLSAHSDEAKDTHEHKGRNQSVADILPRAIAAVQANNELLWFRDSLMVCFNCTDL